MNRLAWILSLIAATALAQPKSYHCRRAQGPVRLDGRIEDRAWQEAAWTDEFLDIEGDAKPRPRFRTRVKMLWDDSCFYVAAQIEEPHVWATLRKHDAVIFHDNDFEVFLDPDGDGLRYYELEMNAFNTTWDLFLPKPYRNGGKAQNQFEIAGLRTAVNIDGTLNDPRDVDRGWSVEIALPWGAFDTSAPPDGAEWRVNFSRVEWEHQVVGRQYVKVKGKREDNWVWSPQGVINMHIPEKWGYVRFGR